MKSTLCHSISKKTFCTIWWRLHDKNETIFTIRCRQGSFVTNISFKCVWYISIGHSVSIKASVWLRHSIHSSISHFHKGKLVWGEISCFYHACMFHMFHIFFANIGYRACPSTFHIFILCGFYGVWHDHVSRYHTWSLLKPYFKAY